MIRQSRKLEHLKYSLLLDDGPAAAGFTDFHLVHNCLPDLAWQDITINTAIADIPLSQPIIINAITGGAADVMPINCELAEFARLTGAAIAVGSQYSAIEDPAAAESYKVVRKRNPNGVIFANLGAHASPEAALCAVEMIGAQAIQIHLNAGQEIIMSEGDRNFSGYLSHIEAIVKKVNVPVIVKEVGCGIAREQAQALTGIGVKVIDVGGSGGTNFLAIEAARGQLTLDAEMMSWGIPTAIAAVEVMSAVTPDVNVVVSGGVRTPLDAVKALALGGMAVGIAGPVLKVITCQGLEEAIRWYENFIIDIKRFMLLIGAHTITDLRSVPMVITGFSQEWLSARGITTAQFAERKKYAKSMA
ncbi:type 2 isopentenyl-diphosphate Delta-isomerase [Sporomusa sp. KB1]|jgi:isopentenyl-diphosphate delta-isomerase|uniref:type 2 isopentenyl-diphosphate Delta-isomerase n=1 Tax=Sporomusa sp. KB1 TaxID=943346 RepID=UPI0011ABF8F8|nr:type 2 isopentenyl-diphosphate Delta-isomerase [Sporomusa sp. KB1]TWH49001.1 isopentenyl-diphosphate delta-isomerase [Sporomusa sp. KB1]